MTPCSTHPTRIPTGESHFLAVAPIEGQWDQAHVPMRDQIRRPGRRGDRSHRGACVSRLSLPRPKTSCRAGRRAWMLGLVSTTPAGKERSTESSEESTAMLIVPPCTSRPMRRSTVSGQAAWRLSVGCGLCCFAFICLSFPVVRRMHQTPSCVSDTRTIVHVQSRDQCPEQVHRIALPYKAATVPKPFPCPEWGMSGECSNGVSGAIFFVHSAFCILHSDFTFHCVPRRLCGQSNIS